MTGECYEDKKQWHGESESWAVQKGNVADGGTLKSVDSDLIHVVWILRTHPLDYGG